jgi:hypothetical protein
MFRWLLTQHQGAGWVDQRHAERIALPHTELPPGYHPHRVTDSKLLPLFADLVGVVDVEAEQVLQPFVAVHAAAVLADLHQPAPHDLGGGLDGDGVGRRGDLAGDDVVAGIGGLDLVTCCAPVPQPRPGDPGHEHSSTHCCQRLHMTDPSDLVSAR